jgi:hypothetical protein
MMTPPNATSHLVPTSPHIKHERAWTRVASPRSEAPFCTSDLVWGVPGAVGALVAALPALEPTDADRAVALTAVLNALPIAKPRAVGALVAALRSISPVPSWLVWLANQGNATCQLPR